MRQPYEDNTHEKTSTGLFFTANKTKGRRPSAFLVLSCYFIGRFDEHFELEDNHTHCSQKCGGSESRLGKTGVCRRWSDTT